MPDNMSGPEPIKRPRWRLRLSRWIYPWWTEDEVDAIKWRAHVRCREMGFMRCVELDWDGQPVIPAKNEATR